MGKPRQRSRSSLQTPQVTWENGTRRPKILAAHGSKGRKAAPNRCGQVTSRSDANLNLPSNVARYNAFIVALQVSIRESGDVTILDLRGRATIGADSDLLIRYLEKLVAKGVRKLLLNLADVTQLDSSSISAITGTHVSLGRQGGSLKLLCPSGRVRDVLRVIRLPDIIPTFEDEAQALTSFRPQGFSARP
jgi:anti-sigma B factor antagonist